MTDTEALQKEITALKARNRRVEADKAWETSRFRTAAVACVTYGVIFLWMWIVGVEKPALSALVPTAGFVLSTLTLRFAKYFWLQYIYRQKDV